MRKLILAGALCAISFPAMADLVIVTETAPPQAYRHEAPGYTGYVERRVAPPVAPEAGCGDGIVRKGADEGSAWGPAQGDCG